MRKKYALLGMMAVAVGYAAGAAGQTASAAQTAAQKPPIYLHCGTLIDGKSEQPRKNVVIVLEQGKIKDIREGQAATESGAIDLSNETCLP